MNAKDLVVMVSSGYHLPSQPKKVDVAHVASKFNKPKQCFDNAYRYLDSLPVNTTDCQYVLGFLLFRGIPVEHAWVKVDGQYFDPTLTSHSDHEYYSLAELEFMELIDVAAMCGCAPSIYDYSRWLRKNPKTTEVTEMSSTTVDDHIDTLLSQLSSEDSEMLASRLASVGYPGDVEMLATDNKASPDLVSWAESHGDPVSVEAGEQADAKEAITSTFSGDGTNFADEPEVKTSVAGWAGLYGSSPWVCVAVDIGQTEPVYNFFFDKADADVFAGVATEIGSSDSITSSITESHMDWIDSKEEWSSECEKRFPGCKNYNVNSNRTDARHNRKVVGYYMKNRKGGFLTKAPAAESSLVGTTVVTKQGIVGLVTGLTESRTHAVVNVSGRDVHYRLDQLSPVTTDFSKEDFTLRLGGVYESTVRIGRLSSLKESTERSRTFVQFSVLDGNTVSASRATVGRLESGVYDVTVDYNTGMPIYSRKSIKSDKLLRFEDSRYNTVMEEVEGFWDMGPRYEELGYVHKRGFLMYGRPGVGKSCISRLVIEDAVAKDCVVFFSKDFGDAVKCIRTFREIEESRKVLFVFEDLDEILGYSEHAFLEFMDGEDSLNGCLVLATTNYPERLPERVMRAGRMDVKVEIHNPPAAGRAAYFQSKVPAISEESLTEMVDVTEDFSFAECREFLVNHLLYNNTAQRASQLVKAVDRLRVESANKAQPLNESFRTKIVGNPKKIPNTTSSSTVGGSGGWDGKGDPKVGERVRVYAAGKWIDGTVTSFNWNTSKEKEDSVTVKVSPDNHPQGYDEVVIDYPLDIGITIKKSLTEGFRDRVIGNPKKIPKTTSSSDITGTGNWVGREDPKVGQRVAVNVRRKWVNGTVTSYHWGSNDDNYVTVKVNPDDHPQGYDEVEVDYPLEIGATIRTPIVESFRAKTLSPQTPQVKTPRSDDNWDGVRTPRSGDTLELKAGGAWHTATVKNFDGTHAEIVFVDDDGYDMHVGVIYDDFPTKLRPVTGLPLNGAEEAATGYSTSMSTNPTTVATESSSGWEDKNGNPFGVYDVVSDGTQEYTVIGPISGVAMAFWAMDSNGDEVILDDWDVTLVSSDSQAYEGIATDPGLGGTMNVPKVGTYENYYYGDGSDEHNQLMKAKSKKLKKELEKALGSSYDYFEDSGYGVKIYKRGKFYVDDPYVNAKFYRSWYEVSYSKGQYGPHSEDERVDSVEEIAKFVKKKLAKGATTEGFRDRTYSSPSGSLGKRPPGDTNPWGYYDNEYEHNEPPRASTTSSSSDNLNGYDLGDRLRGVLGREFHVDSQDSQTVFIYFDGETGEDDEVVEVEISDDGYYVGHARKGDYKLRDRENLKNSDDVADYIQGHMTRLTEGFRDRTTEDNDMNTGDGSSSSSSSSDTQSDDEMLKNMSMHTDRDDFEKKADELGITIKKAADSDYVYAYQGDNMVGEFDTKNNAGFIDQRDLEL